MVDEEVEATCQDDMSGTDWMGDNCEWYYDHTHWCGFYDTSSFEAEKDCCACGGGSFAEMDPIVYPAQENCDDNLEVTDAFGDDCTWYVDQVHTCGMYDFGDFKAERDCCVCIGITNYWQ